MISSDPTAKPTQIWCIGRNYSEHAKELNNSVPSEPLIFTKSIGTLCRDSVIELPVWAKDVHHEIEIVLQITQSANDWTFSHVGLGLDLTERTIQGQLKSKSYPWTLAKSFKNSAPISPMVNIVAAMAKLSNEFGNKEKSLSPTQFIADLGLQFYLDGELRQSGIARDMIFPPQTMVQFLAERFPLCSGDLLFTGTPAGVGPVKRSQSGRAVLLWKDQQLLQWEMSFS